MSMPPNLKAKYLKRFDQLIEEGNAVLATVTQIRVGAGTFEKPFGGTVVSRGTLMEQIDSDGSMEFQHKTITLLANVLPTNHPNRTRVENPTSFRSDETGVKSSIALLKATKDDLEQGFLESLAGQIEAEIGSDYLGQAEKLLKEGSSGVHEYVPAAVLAGAVLERALRTLCDNRTPPIATLKPNGEPMTLNPLIDALKKADVFKEPKAKQLRTWADIRNAAAHGEWQKFNRDDVEMMLTGVSTFLAEVL